jgi:hypothetical protein
LVVPIGGRDLLKLVAIAIFVDVGIKHFKRTGLRQIRHPSRDDVQRIVGASSGAILLHDLGEHLGCLNFDNFHLDASEFLPFRAGEIQRIKRLQSGLPDDCDRGSLVFLRFANGDLRGTFGHGGRCPRQSKCGKDAGPRQLLHKAHTYLPLQATFKPRPPCYPPLAHEACERNSCICYAQS